MLQYPKKNALMGSEIHEKHILPWKNSLSTVDKCEITRQCPGPKRITIIEIHVTKQIV